MNEPSRIVKIHTIEWRDGHPFPVEKEVVTKEDARVLHFAAQTRPYEGKKDDDGYFINEFEKQMHGRPCLEVANYRKVQKAAEGDNEMIKYNEDRTLGKPTQHQETLSVAMQWSDFTKHVLATDAEQPLVDPEFQEEKEFDLTDDYHLIEETTAIEEDEILETEAEPDYLEEYL